MTGDPWCDAPVNRRNATPAVVTAVLATLLAGTSCSLLGGGRSAQDEADDLAAALTAGRLGTVSFTGGTRAQAQQLWDSTVAGLGEQAEATVSVDGVTEGEDGRPSTARLRYSWSLPGAEKPWTYGTTVELDESDDDSVGDEGWRVRLAPSLVHPDLAAGDRLAARRTFAARAAIRGAGGTPLVTERPVQRFGIDKLRVPKARELSSARELAAALGIDAEAYVARVRAAGDRAFVEAIVLRAPEARAALRAGAGDVPGVALVRDTLPLAPTRDFARPLLGTFGAVTAEIVKESDGAYVAGDEAGLSGLQARYDEQLRGTPGLTVEGPGGKDLFTSAPVPGTPLRTTLDVPLQRLAEQTLAGVRPASALVAIRPSTGDLLAVASGPGSEGYSTATVGQYAPGSTFKVVSSLALLRSGVRPATPVSCPATTVVDGKRFKNYDDYPADGLGEISFATAVANSCNTAFIGQRDAVTQAEVADAAASLGLGVDHDLGFPAYFGSVPATAAAAGSDTGRAASLIGQGKVLASPMAMAAVAASVARGEAVVPRLLPAQETDDDPPPTPLTAAEAAQLRSLMRGVVTRGSGAFLATVPGAPVLAKTGTAEFGTRAPLQTHAWMIAAQGVLAVAVFVDVGDSGSGTAGPLLERFLRGAR